jgi:23S rRNA (uracil1939-C5)-methyltransferase
MLEAVEIIDIADKGKGVGRVDDVVVFVTGGVPGDIVDVMTTKKKKSFYEARILKFIKKSDARTEAFCEHFGVCGGCKWQNLEYASQLKFKQKQVADTLIRIGKVESEVILPILGSAETSYYRNKLEFTFSNKRWLTFDEKDKVADYTHKEMNALGFHVPGRFDKVVGVNHCHLQADPSNKIRLTIRDYAQENNLTFFDIKDHHGLLRNLIVRTATTGDLMVILSFYENDETAIFKLLDYLHAEVPEITALMYVHNAKMNDTLHDQDIKVYKGKDYIIEKLDGLSFKIGPKSFFQTNSVQAKELYDVAKSFADIQPEDLVYDLYCGTGSITNYVADKAKQVIGVEYVEDAIKDAFINSELNNITNTDFYAGDMKKVLDDTFIKKHGKPNVVITDPPRAGMDKPVVEKLLELDADRIVYVSCNPATQARDVEILSSKYKATKVQPVDMFPHTHHVENVALLVKK